MSDPVVLFAWPGTRTLVSSSPFCMKVLHGLRYKKIPHELRYVTRMLPAWAKLGTLPVIEWGSLRIEDSTQILKAIDAHGDSSTKLYPANPELLAETLLLEDWADESLVLSLVYYRWTPEANFARFSEEVFASIPKPLRGFILPRIRKGMQRVLRARQIGLLTEKERIGRFEDALKILESRLSRTAFLVGDSLTAADLSAYGTIEQILSSKIEPLDSMIRASAKVMDWQKRLQARIGTGAAS